MSKQRDRHLRRQPAEEFARQAVADLVADAGVVDVERHTHDWRADDLLIWVRLHQPISGQVLTLFRSRVAEKLKGQFSLFGQLDDWLVVVECKGEQICTIASKDSEPGIDEV